ncbi:biosynthetic peptidoglycan transglycosylase [Thermospira aquatica]|uniref:Transglycosylase domain-containing protein n=1 Tax=Thermospira aquatica TaxID=2828656 RepID=A0AAX3BAQ7_9SPIR|nr:biosynthetic peptidoglycan transglycosylase [Thermospira aquatica]URA09336.1 transglycosylase domain-containing protein [Thermospira aquatica]
MIYRQWIQQQRVYPIVYIRLKDIPSDIRTMVISLEDDGFYRHHGVEWVAIRRAFERNMKLRKPFYGGSTITQQLSRTLFLWPGKSYIRKYLEFLIALEMELVLPKKRILELYLNTAEWGPGIFGIQQGSFYHYHVPVWMLSKDQKMRLLVILSSPVKYRPYDFGKLKILYQRYSYLKSIFGE